MTGRILFLTVALASAMVPPPAAEVEPPVIAFAEPEPTAAPSLWPEVQRLRAELWATRQQLARVRADRNQLQAALETQPVQIPNPGYNSTTLHLQAYVQQQAQIQHGWTGEQWEALDWIVQHESGWDPHADNPTSTARYLGQHLAATSKTYGMPHLDRTGTHPTIPQQVDALLQYIADRYDTPIAAEAFWRSHGWY